MSPGKSPKLSQIIFLTYTQKFDDATLASLGLLPPANVAAQTALETTASN